MDSTFCLVTLEADPQADYKLLELKDRGRTSFWIEHPWG